MRLLNKAVILALTLLPVTIYATSTICHVKEEDVLGVEVIAWDEQKKTAKISDGFNETHRGIVTYIRKHNDGKKVNLYIKYSKPYFGADAAELIIFPTTGEEFRVIGVTYIVKDNKQFLNTFMGNQTAICRSI